MKPTLPQELSWGSRRGILKSGDPREPFYIVIQAVCCWDKQMREFKRRENFFCFMESELMVHGFWLHCCWARRRQNIIAERCGAKLFTSRCLEKGERRDRRGRERKRRGEEDRQTDLGRTAPKEQGSLLRSLSPSSWSHLWKPPSPLISRWIHQWITPLLRPEPSWSNNFREWIWDLGTNREEWSYVVCRRMNATGDSHIREIKAASERQILCFLSFQDFIYIHEIIYVYVACK